MTPRFHRLSIADVRRETDEAVSIAFAVPPELAENYRYTPGQHLILRHKLDGEEVRRTYSICSGLDEGELRVAVKRTEGGRFSAFANVALQQGTELDVMTPAGRFVCQPDPTTPHLYVGFAAGSGITPILAIVKSVLAREPESRFLLFYGNRDGRSILFREELEDLKNSHLDRFGLFHLLSREPQEVELLSGRLDRAKVAEICRSLIRPAQVDGFFLCGPGSMIAEASAALRDAGVPGERIHFELFSSDAGAALQAERPAAPPRPHAAGTAAQVTVVLDGKRTDFALPYGNGSILDAAIARGLDLPFSCKGGVCATCRCKLVEGEVDMAVNYALEPWELDAGFVLGCQSRPLSKRVVVDFDAV